MRSLSIRRPKPFAMEPFAPPDQWSHVCQGWARSVAQMRGTPSPPAVLSAAFVQGCRLGSASSWIPKDLSVKILKSRQLLVAGCELLGKQFSQVHPSSISRVAISRGPTGHFREDYFRNRMKGLRRFCEFGGIDNICFAQSESAVFFGFHRPSTWSGKRRYQQVICNNDCKAGKVAWRWLLNMTDTTKR